MFSVGLAYMRDGAKWFDGNIKTVPYVGNGYTLFCEKVGKPVWDLGCKAKDAAAPHFNKIKDPVIEIAAKYPRVTFAVEGVVSIALTYCFIRAIYKNFASSAGQ
jgi:hypothetical protein